MEHQKYLKKQSQTKKTRAIEVSEIYVQSSIWKKTRAIKISEKSNSCKA